jgi:uncharacterized membrane protein
VLPYCRIRASLSPIMAGARTLTISPSHDRSEILWRGAVFVLVLLLLVVLLVPTAVAQEDENQTQVHAILFFMTTCGHCEYVIYQVLFPVVFPENGGEPVIYYDTALADAGEEVPFYIVTNGSLEMLFVNAGGPIGSTFFHDASVAIGVPEEVLGAVPLLIVDDSWYMGSGDIPALFPGVVEEGFAEGGIPWPDVPGIEDVVAGVPRGGDGTVTTTTLDNTTVTTTPSSDGIIPVTSESMLDLFATDQPANSVALVVLLLMVGSLIVVAAVFRRGGGEARFDALVPVLALIGLGLAIYLAYIESSGTTAVCGPVGDCNTVQQSKYAKLFGVIPIGIIGVAGYAVSLVAWFTARVSRRPLADWARLALFAGSLGGTAFSVYLTFLEPFVIGATCAWCVGSAVVVTLLMLITALPAAESWRRLSPAPAPQRPVERGVRQVSRGDGRRRGRTSRSSRSRRR